MTSTLKYLGIQLTYLYWKRLLVHCLRNRDLPAGRCPNTVRSTCGPQGASGHCPNTVRDTAQTLCGARAGLKFDNSF